MRERLRRSSAEAGERQGIAMRSVAKSRFFCNFRPFLTLRKRFVSSGVAHGGPDRCSSNWPCQKRGGVLLTAALSWSHPPALPKQARRSEFGYPQNGDKEESSRFHENHIGTAGKEKAVL
jgi:hypothetical protein